MLHNFRASRKILQKSKTLGSDILPPSRQDANDGSNAIIPTHGEVSEGEIKNILLRAFASLREIFRFFRLRLCCAGSFVVREIQRVSSDSPDDFALRGLQL
jgi:hypothetical protein